MKADGKGGSALKCFDTCDCRCGEGADEFDELIARETRFPFRFDDICRAGIGWYGDRSLDSSGTSGWALGGRAGLYFLWHKDDYCPRHERFHMRALYVGKGRFDQRLRAHWEGKDTSRVMLVYFSFVELENRVAKYVEQLLLDLYHFPLNTAENPGKRRLCAHFNQGEVD